MNCYNDTEMTPLEVMNFAKANVYDDNNNENVIIYCCMVCEDGSRRYDYYLNGMNLNCYTRTVQEAVEHFRRNWVYNSQMMSGYTILDIENWEVIDTVVIEYYDDGTRKYIRG